MSNKTFPLFLLILLACIWGSSFILMKRGMETTDGIAIFTDSQVGALRMLIAALVLLPITLFSLKKLTSFKDFISLTIVGTCGNFVPAFLFTYAETELSSGYAGMMNTFTSIFALLIGVLIFRQKLLANQVTGILIAFSGMVFLMYAGQQLDSAGTWKHVGAIILATFLYGISLNTIKHRLSHLKAMEITSLAFGILLLPGIAASYSSGSFEVMKTNSHAWEGLGYIAILSIVGTALALLIFNRVIGLTSTLFASSVTYLIPIVAVFIGMLNGEHINIMQVSAMIVVLGGVFLANSKFSK
ncbi:MAG: DMT family transporter [Bacteroidota bacterium]